MMLRLPDLVGSPLSINALREDLQVAHKTVATWLDAIERLYALFRIPPFGAPRIRAVKQERKHYHFDWSVVSEPGARFENLVACHLLKWVHHQQDTEGRDLELRFFRDVDGREVDFVVLEDRRPVQLVECKLADRDIDRGLRYLKARFPSAEAFQIAMSGERDFVTPAGIRDAGGRLPPAARMTRPSNHLPSAPCQNVRLATAEVAMPRIESVTAELLHDRTLVNVIIRVRDSDGLEGVGEAWWGIYDARQPSRTASPITAVVNDMLAPKP